MSIKASVQKGFGVARQSLLVVGILSLFGFVWNLINLHYAPQVQQNPQAAVSVVIIISTIIFLFVSIFLQSGTLGYVRDKIKKGQANFSVFISSGSQYYLRLFSVGLLITLVAIVFVLLAAIFVALLKTVGIVIAVVLAIILVYLIFQILFAPYIVVIHDEKAVASMKRSVALVSKDMNFFLGILLMVLSIFVAIAYLFPSFQKSKLGQKNLVKIIVITFILLLVGFMVGLLTGVLLGLLNVAVPGPVSQVIYALISSLLNSFLGVFATASFMTFYLEITNTSGV